MGVDRDRGLRGRRYGGPIKRDRVLGGTATAMDGNMRSRPAAEDSPTASGLCTGIVESVEGAGTGVSMGEVTGSIGALGSRAVDGEVTGGSMMAFERGGGATSSSCRWPGASSNSPSMMSSDT